MLEAPGMEWQVYAWGYHDGRTGIESRIESFNNNYRQVYEYGFTRGKEDREILGEFTPHTT